MRFIPPLEPNFGGVHETMIKSAKKAIRAVLGNADVNDEELMTVFTGAEDLLQLRSQDLLIYISSFEGPSTRHL